MFKRFQTIGKIAKTVASPITHAKNVISSTFRKKPKFDKKEEVSKYRKEALKLTKENTAKAGKAAKEAESKIGKEEAQKLGRETKSKMMQDFLKYNKNLKAKGGRIGYKGGKLVGNQKKIDVAPPFGTINKKDFKVLQAKNKNKKKVIG